MVNWKLPAGFSAAGALVSLIAGIAGGNSVGAVLLRLLISAALAGGVGFAVQFILRRFLPELTSQAGRQEAPAVDIVIDDQVDLGFAGSEPEGREAGPTAEVPELPAEFGGGGPPDAEAASDLPADFMQTAEALTPHAEEQGPQSMEALEVPEAVGPLEEAEELAAPEGAGELGELERLPSLDSLGPSTTTRRGLQVEKVEAQVDNLVKQQDPASLAKAVRSFMNKD